MKKLIYTVLLITTTLSGYAQFYHNIEFGGSNFTGLSLTTEYHIHFNKDSPFYLAPKLGIGHIFGWEHAMTAQFGLAFGYTFRNGDRLELNSNASYLFKSPFLPGEGSEQYFYSGPEERGSFIWYTGLDYRFMGKKLNYTIGAGMMILISNPAPGYYQTAGDDFVPMLKFGIGF